MNPQDEDEAILGKILEFVKSKKQPVTVRLSVSHREGFDWEKFLRGMEEVRAITEKTPIDLPPDTDINDIIDEMNDVEL